MPAIAKTAPEAQTAVSKNVLKDILRHEREFRNVNWLEELLDESGAERPDFVKSLIRAARAKGAAATVGVTHQLTTPDDAEILDVMAIRRDAYQRISGYRGDAIKDYLLTLIKHLQDAEKELQKKDINWNTVAASFTAASVVAVGAKVVPFVVKNMAAGMTYAASLAAGMGAVAIAAVSVLVIALVAFVILMLKDAREFHLVMNNTDYELRVYGIYRNHGKVNFLPYNDDLFSSIGPRYNDEKGEAYILAGFFGMSKKSGALVGCDGVIQLDMYNKNGMKHQTCTFLAYEVPLTGVFGGPNGCFAKCSVGNPSAEEFFKKNVKAIESGLIESKDSSGNIDIVKRIASKSGSESYAITCYNQK